MKRFIIFEDMVKQELSPLTKEEFYHYSDSHGLSHTYTYDEWLYKHKYVVLMDFDLSRPHLIMVLTDGGISFEHPYTDIATLNESENNNLWDKFVIAHGPVMRIDMTKVDVDSSTPCSPWVLDSRDPNTGACNIRADTLALVCGGCKRMTLSVNELVFFDGRGNEIFRITDKEISYMGKRLEGEEFDSDLARGLLDFIFGVLTTNAKS